MLEKNYPRLFAILKETVQWQFELPAASTSAAFDRPGLSAGSGLNIRRSPRIRTRHKAVMHFSEPLPAFPRPTKPVSIYTNDLSRSGLGCLCREQLYPGERVHILLSHGWMEATITRGRRLGPQCFEAGAVLSAAHLLESDDFRLPPWITAHAGQ